MYQVVFYEDKNGFSELYEYLNEIKEKSKTNKDYRIQFKQITTYIELLANYGFNLSIKIAKHIVDGVWELRPGKNRILYFYYEKDTYVLLHIFRKTTNKTPKNEIEKAKREMNDYCDRMGEINK